MSTADPGADRVHYWVDRHDRIARVNDAWTRFALENDAPELAAERVVGRPLFECVVDVATRHLYTSLLDRARGGVTMRFPLRCDSPTMRRRLHMVLGPAGDGTVLFDVVLVSAEPRPAQPVWQRDAPRSNAMLRVCSWCKRVRAGDDWLEVEGAIPRLALFDQPRPPQLTHGICPECRAALEVVLNSNE